jgi:DNA repair exonuclease SbcCD ATPase subunit
MFRDAVRSLRVGNIETWWSSEQFALRAMEPPLRHIAGVGERMQRLRARLQAVKQDILQSSIAGQTEATRDNTHRLERIQAELREIAREAQKSTRLINMLTRTQFIFGGLYFFTMFLYAAITLYIFIWKL